MQNSLYLTAMLNKLRGDYTKWFGAPEAFRAATMGGAKALGRDHELGAVQKGRVADLVAYRLHSFPFTPLNNVVNQLVYAANRHEVDFVMVDGEAILANGKLTRIDEDRLLGEIQAAHLRIEPQLTASEKDVERLREPYERIYNRCQHIAIAPDTHPARFSH
jgi:guanine deaminase